MFPVLRPHTATVPVVDARYYANNHDLSNGSAASGKLIPRRIWVAVKDANATLNHQIPELFRRNPQWSAHVCGNNEKDLFMSEQFANTSILWAYNLIAPWAGAAKADIWRYVGVLCAAFVRPVITNHM